MKKVLSILVLMFFITTNGFSQAINESFESGTFPPTGWTSTGDWTTLTSTAHDGTTSAYVSDIEDGGRLVLPLYTADETTMLSFWLACTYASYSDQTTLTVEVAFPSEEELVWTTVQTITYPQIASLFEYHEISLAAYDGEEIYVSFNVINLNGSGTIIDEVSLFNLTCPRPMNISHLATMTSVDLTWDEVSAANSYNVQIAQANQTWEQGQTLTSTTASIEITDLQPATSYKVRVASACEGEDVSNWSDVYTFNTLCAESISELPYVENFDHLNCWTALQTYTDPYYGTYPLINDNVFVTGFSQTMIANSSALDLDLSTVEARFLAFSYYYYAPPTLTIGYTTSLTDASTFVGMNTITIDASDYEEFTVPFTEWELEEGTDYYLAIKFNPNSEYDQIYLENFVLTTIPDCPAPERNSVAVVANAENAVVSWVDNNEEHEAWIVYYRQQGEEEWQTADASETSVTITELLPETTYEVYVMTECGTADNTDQTYPVTFTTTRLPIELPYFQDFENAETVTEFSYYHDYAINKWTIGTATAFIDEESEETTGGSMYISNDNGVTNAYTHTYDNSTAGLLVYFAPGMEYSLSFNYKVGGESSCDYLRVYALDATTPLVEYYNGTPISDMLSNTGTWAEFTYNIPESWIGTTKQIAFFWRNDGSDGDQPAAAIDNLKITATTCTRPSEVTVAEVSENSATITWEGEADSYLLSYYLISDPASAIVEEVTGNTVTLSELTMATSYGFTLQSVCGDDYSPVTAQFTFNTSCGLIEGPNWFENFESVSGNQEAANQLFACWYVLQSTGGWYNGSFPRIYHEGHQPSAHSGEVTLEFKGNGFLALPEFATPLNELQLSFYANTTAATVEDAGIMEVGYLTNVTDTSSFVVVATVTPVGLQRNGSHLSGPYLFDEIEDTEGRIALRYRAAVSDESWNLDDFTVEPIPSCPSPVASSVTVTNITEDEATISWVDNDETHSAWIVYYKASTDEEYSSVSATEQTVTLTGLEMVTEYTVYVQTDCGIEDNYSQTSPVTFRTSTTPIEDFPYVQDFEDLETTPFNAEFFGTGDNQWHFGTATAVPTDEETATSMYISNDNGTSYFYNSSSSSYAYAVVPIVFGDDLEYTITFDYKVMGEPSNWDIFSVVLADTVPTSGNAPSGISILSGVTNVTNWTTVNYSSSSLSNTTKSLIFYWKNDGYGYGGSAPMPAAIDNFSITSSSCSSPTEFALVSSAETEATFSWAESDASAWILYYKAESEAEYTAVEVTENPYTVTGLIPATSYNAYLVADCSGELSGASSSVSFRTQCAAVDEYPYFQSFETLSFTDICWSTAVESGYDNWGISSWPIGDQVYPIDGSKMAKITYTSAVTRLMTPKFDLTELSNPYLKFSYLNPQYGGVGEHIIVQYKASEESTWTDLMSITTPHENWVTDSVALPNVSETYQIAFKLVGQYANGAAIDAVYVYDSEGEPGENPDPDPEPEPCDAPTNLTVSNITENSADVSWNGTATTYELRLNGGEAETLTTTSKQLIGLPDNFTITVEVRAICESQVSEWVSTTFTTLPATDPDPEPEPCDAPTALSASNITETTAEITWVSTAEAYEFKLNGGTAETLTTTTKALTGLTANTAYTVEVRAICGEQQSAWVSATFTTLEEIPEIIAPVVTTTEATSVTHESAVLNGTITAGSEEITAQGFRYKTATASEWIEVSATGTTISATVNNLTAETAYVFKAFATTVSGTVEGTEMTFTTIAAPIVVVEGEVTTTPATNIANTSATLNGALVSAGNSENYTIGFALATVADFTLEDAGVQNITATLTDNAFTATVNDLVEGQTYFYRAYITNEAGTAYGTVETFTLLGLTDALANQIAVSLYPNPASDNATLDINGLNQDAKIVISDLQGRILSQDNINAGTTRYTINVSDMTSGVYYIRIITDNVVSTQKLIVE
ncbi:MAG: fibronectin type III domain-containing protein [Bacteroidales bacterium]|nr:fibronectin type III domain-containing protein [Bacteroidales bacterium]